MKTKMLNSLLLAVSITAGLFLNGCANDEDLRGAHPADEPACLAITTGINAPAAMLKAGPVAAFPEGSALGLFLTKGSTGEDYYSPAVSRNVKSTFSAGAWVQSPPVNLYTHPATVYAYYPYHQNNSASDGSNIMVASGVTDYMYGTHTPGQAAINKDNRAVHLTMNHALALVQFELYKQDYPWKGELTMIRVTNAPGKSIVHMSASINIATGEIMNLYGEDMAIQLNSSSLGIIPDTPPGDEASFQKLMLVPTSATVGHGEVRVSFTIDGREYVWEVPSGTEWKQGTKNTYRILLQGNALQVASVNITDWTEGAFSHVTLE